MHQLKLKMTSMSIEDDTTVIVISQISTVRMRKNSNTILNFDGTNKEIVFIFFIRIVHSVLDSDDYDTSWLSYDVAYGLVKEDEQILLLVIQFYHIVSQFYYYCSRCYAGFWYDNMGHQHHTAAVFRRVDSPVHAHTINTAFWIHDSPSSIYCIISVTIDSNHLKRKYQRQREFWHGGARDNNEINTKVNQFRHNFQWTHETREAMEIEMKITMAQWSVGLEWECKSTKT